MGSLLSNWSAFVSPLKSRFGLGLPTQNRQIQMSRLFCALLKHLVGSKEAIAYHR